MTIAPLFYPSGTVSIVWNRNGTIVTLFYANQGILAETDRLPVLRLPVLVYFY